MRLALVGLLAFGLATPALAQAQPDQPQPDPPDLTTTVSPVQIDKPDPSKPPEVVASDPSKDPKRLVCKREHVVGSNRPQKICMTAGRRQELKDQADRVLDPGNRTAGTRNDFSANPTP